VGVVIYIYIFFFSFLNLPFLSAWNGWRKELRVIRLGKFHTKILPVWGAAMAWIHLYHKIKWRQGELLNAITKLRQLEAKYFPTQPNGT